MFVQWPAVSFPGSSMAACLSGLSHPFKYCHGSNGPFAPKRIRFERTGPFRVTIRGRFSTPAFTNRGGFLAIRRNCMFERQERFPYLVELELELELTLTRMIQNPVLRIGVFARSAQVKSRALPIGGGGGTTRKKGR